MSKTRLVVLLIIGIFFLTITTIAEEITLTTYYPAPYGEYQQLYVSGNVGIGTTGPTAILQVSSTATQDLFGVDDAGPGDTTPFVINQNGNVGIGTTDPGAYKLYVNGPIFMNDPGSGRFGKTIYDVAEDILASDCEPGDVVIIDPNSNEKVIRCNNAYGTTVAGIISETPAFYIGSEKDKEAYKPLALAGRVLCKVTTRGGGPIKRGDLLVTSSKPGYAMRAKPDKVRIGTVLGKALEPLDKGDGKIMVLVTLE